MREKALGNLRKMDDAWDMSLLLLHRDSTLHNEDIDSIAVELHNSRLIVHVSSSSASPFILSYIHRCLLYNAHHELSVNATMDDMSSLCAFLLIIMPLILLTSSSLTLSQPAYAVIKLPKLL